MPAAALLRKVGEARGAAGCGMAETASAGIAAQEARRDAGLRRGIGPIALAAAIVNVVVGAGIFSLPAGMAQAAGPYALAAYLICALAMGAVVLCCAEAGSRVPTSGGIYGYVEAAFGPLPGFIAGVLLWLSCVLACGGIAAALAGAIGRLAPALAGAAPRALIIAVAVAVLAAINCLGVRTASRLISWATAVKLIPLALFVGVGVFFIDPSHLGAGASTGVSGLGRAVILSLFAFQGMETVLGANGEVDNPTRTLPRALIGSMAFVAVLYIAIQLVAEGLLGADLAGSTEPLADAMARVSPGLGTLILLGAILSRFAWIGSDLLGAPRVLFAFARDGFLPGVLGKVSERTAVPAPAIILHGVLAIALGVTGTFEQLAALSVLFTCLLYVGGCLAAGRLSRRDVALAGAPLRLPGLALWVALGAGSMLVVIALGQPLEIAGLVVAVLVSCALYAVTRQFRARRAAV